MPQNSEDSYRSQASTILQLSFKPSSSFFEPPPPSAFSVSTTWLINVNRCQLCQMFLPSLNLQATSNHPPSRGESNTSKAPSSRCNAAARHCISSTPDSTEAAEGEAASCICERWDPSWWIQLRVEWMDGSKLVMICNDWYLVLKVRSLLIQEMGKWNWKVQRMDELVGTALDTSANYCTKPCCNAQPSSIT